MTDPFAALGLTASATEADIRSAWRKAAREHPPETDPAGFERVRAAYERIRDTAALARSVLDAPPPALPVLRDPYGQPTPRKAAEDLLRFLLATGRIRFD